MSLFIKSALALSLLGGIIAVQSPTADPATDPVTIPGTVPGFGTTTDSCDVNADGVTDLVIGSYWFSDQVATVKLGPVSADSKTLAFTPGGSSYNMGIEVRCSPDTNGDGVSDLLLTMQGGGTAVVFGGSTLQSLELNQLGDAGVRFSSNQILKTFGVGDLNGDGKSELAHITANAVYITDTLPATGAPAGSYDFSAATKIITGDTTTLLSAAAAGDVNGDGKPDLVLGSPNASPDGGAFAGKAYVLTDLQPQAGKTVVLSDGFTGFSISGPKSGHTLLATSVAGIGDINGDGFADLLTGNPGHDNPDGTPNPGSATVILGAASNADVKTERGVTDRAAVTDADGKHRGWWIEGLRNADHLGEGKVSAARVNGTTLLLLGAMDGDLTDAAAGSGYAAVIDTALLLEHGAASPARSLTELAAADSRVQLFNSKDPETRFGRSLSAVNLGDGGFTLVIGAPANFSQSAEPAVILQPVTVKAPQPQQPGGQTPGGQTPGDQGGNAGSGSGDSGASTGTGTGTGNSSGNGTDGTSGAGSTGSVGDKAGTTAGTGSDSKLTPGKARVSDADSLSAKLAKTGGLNFGGIALISAGVIGVAAALLANQLRTSRGGRYGSYGSSGYGGAGYGAGRGSSCGGYGDLD